MTVSPDYSRALTALRESRDSLRAELSRIDDSGWGYRPPSGSWTVAEIVEHLAAAERSSAKLLARLVADPVEAPATTTDADMSAGDNLLWERVADSPTPREAPEFIRPKGRYATRAEAETALDLARDQVISLAENATVDLRRRVAPHPALGIIDGVQWLLFLAAHLKRHVRQIHRLANEAGFPAGSGQPT
jgi:hypothetical protein